MASHMSNYDGGGYNAFNLPPELEPLSAWAYVGYSILYAIPVIGLIFLIVFSISDKNINRRSFSRSYLCMALLIVIAIAVLSVTGVGAQLVASFQDGSLQTQVSQTVGDVIGA